MTILELVKILSTRDVRGAFTYAEMQDGVQVVKQLKPNDVRLALGVDVKLRAGEDEHGR